VQAFARTAQLELLDFVRSMIEQRRLRDPMGGRAKAGDKFMVEVDQFVIGLREPQFEKCKSDWIGLSQAGAEALSETHHISLVCWLRRISS
jgi:hypothetical protein